MMTTRSKRSRFLIGVGLVAMGLSAACGQLNPAALIRPDSGAGANANVAPQSGTTTNPVPVPASAPTAASGPRSVAVTRDSIAETLALDGLVAPQEQVQISYPGHGIVADIPVKPGQTVQQGDVLLQLDSVELMRQMNSARGKLQASVTNLAQAQAQAQRSELTVAQRAAADRQKQQVDIADAVSGLRHAQDNLAKVQVGASPADRQLAQNGLDAAQANLQRVQDALDKLVAGPDANEIRAAQRDVATNQTAYARAQADLDALTRGPDPQALREAEGALQRAQTQLKVAKAAKVDPKSPDPALSRIQLDGAIQDAQLAVQAAQDREAKLKVPPVDTDVQTARQRVQDARDALSNSKAKLETMLSGADQTTLDAAQAAVDSAQQGVNVATAHLDEVRSHPTSSELADALDQVHRAQTTLDNARRPLPPPDANDGTDLAALQKVVEQDQTEVDTLQQSLDKSLIVAPFDGTIVAIRVKAGDPITATKPVFVLAKPGAPIVTVDLADDEAKRLAVGQHATIQVDAGNGPGAPVPAMVAVLTPAAQDGSKGASASFQVTWAENNTPRFGLPVQISVMLQVKQGVLVIPKSALRQLGTRASVEIQDGTIRRLVNVQLGITTATTAEVVAGLTEGQLVLTKGS